MFCNAYVPGLQYAAGLVAYVHRQLGLPIASTAPLALITEAFDKAVHRFARDHGLPWVDSPHPKPTSSTPAPNRTTFRTT